MSVQIGVLGDIHLHFSAEDVAYFNESNYDLLLFVGDLAHFYPNRALPVARLIAQINKPALFIPGNHDTVGLLQLVAEAKNIPLLTAVTAITQHRKVKQLAATLGNTVFCGYSTHSYTINGHSFDVIAGRPFSMGGARLNFKPYLRKQYQIHSLEDSIARLQQCVDAAQSDQLVFLAHNGPAGLGNGHNDIWGCDFKPEGGDFGDRDLQAAITYARQQGKQVTAVIGGHMHHQTKKDGSRTWRVEQNGTHYINAAQVPRIIQKNGTQVHHYIHIVLDSFNTIIEPKQFNPNIRN